MVMTGAFFKDIYREIFNTKGRFLGIMAIVALGVAFFAGLGATGFDMKLNGYTYFKTQQLMDIRVVSTYGLNDNDVKAIVKAESVQYAFATYTMDAQVTHNSLTGNVKLHAYSADAPINQPVLLYGTLPQKANETVVEAGLLSRLGFSVGDTLTLQSGKSSDIRNRLRNQQYVITGVVQSPLYISRERGTSSIGRGEVDYYMMIPQSNFLSDVYTEVIIQVEGAEALPCFNDAYEEKIDEVVTAIENIGTIRIEERAREMTANAYRQLREAEKALERNITETDLLLAEADAGLAEATAEMPGNYASLTGTLTDIITAERSLDESLSQIISGLSTIRDADTQLDVQEATLYASRAELMEYEIYLGAEFTERMRDVNDGLDAVATARGALSQERQRLYASFVELADTKEALRATLNEVYDGSRPLLAGAYEITQREKELTAERQQLTARLEEARQTLEKTREDLDDLDDPKWYVLDRDANPGYAGYSDDTGKIEAIGRVFPLIFYIVAALVCLTSMTRLVEERRTEIGTLKSLGYGNARIVSKYLIYALTPTLMGGLAGGAVGMTIFPKIIINAYNMLYSMPSPETPMHTGFWSMGLFMGLVATGVATVYACVNELRETPSNLLRPKAPKAGKRNIFERLPFLWQRLNFNQKVTVRNLLRYKKRLYMTVIGISGCTALLLTGFGLRDSIADIIVKQFSDLSHYDMVVSFSESALEKDVTRANDLLTADSICKRTVKTRQKTMDAGISGSGKVYQATLVVPEDAAAMHSFITFRDRATHDMHTLNENGVIITEKLARLLNVKVNDRFELTDGDDRRVTVQVAAITETYFMHYIYMHPVLYNNLFGEVPINNTIYAMLTDADTEAENELARVLLDEKGVNGVSFIQSSVRSFSDVISNLDFVVYVLIISAGALALVVLLNLTNININERVRELATIEVLGFYDREVSAYIYRENIILTVIGAGVGLLMGYFLHLYVILTAETDIMMFSRDIKPLSFILSVALTFFFALIVNLLTASKLKNINMVEALKSVE